MLLIEKFLISPYLLLGILIGVAGIGWLFAVKLYIPGDKFWRVSNFIGLLFTCLGIFGVVKDSRQFFYERESNRHKIRIEAEFQWRLVYNLNEELYCREFVETKYSPKNLQNLQEDYNATYQWIKDNKDYLSDCFYKQKLIDVDSIHYPVLQTPDQVLIDYYTDLQQCISDYNNDLKILEEYQNGVYPNYLELLYIIFSPLFLAIGLGWEFVKFFAKR